MERLLQKIVQKFIKKIDPNKLVLKKVEQGEPSTLGPFSLDGTYYVYKIKYNHLTIGTIVTVVGNNGVKYLSNIDIIAPFRNLGIGSYLLRHYFSGYYIMADNSRASKLYARLGKMYNKFTHKEFEDFIRLCGMHGVYKLDSIIKRTPRKSLK
jgi:hypothetical protein